MDSFNQSWRHHYIPEFFIKRFYPDGQNGVWVYDKEKRRTEFKAAKSRFFNPHGNNIQINSKETSILENFTGKIDNYFAEAFNKIQGHDREQLESNYEFILNLDIFIYWMFWRIPKFDMKVTRRILEDLSSIQENSSLELSRITNSLDEQSIVRVLRHIVPFDFLERQAELLSGNKKYIFYRSKEPIFLLSDVPMIAKKHPDFKLDLLESLIFPIDPYTAYIILENQQYNLTTDILTDIIMVQLGLAEKYIASPNRKHIDQCVKLHTRIHLNLPYRALIDDIFIRINAK